MNTSPGSGSQVSPVSPAVGGFHTQPNPALGLGHQFGQPIQSPNQIPLRRPMPFPGLQNMPVGQSGLLGR